MKTIITTCDCCQKQYPQERLFSFHTDYGSIYIESDPTKIYLCEPCTGIKMDKEGRVNRAELAVFIRDVLEFYGERK